MKRLFYLISALILFAGCNNSGYKNTPIAHGNPGDIVVVMNNDSWNSEPGDTLRAVFHDYCYGVPMEEHWFDLHQIPKDKFIDQNRFHRNIIFQEINPEIKEAKLTVFRDRYAQKQVFVNVVAPNQAEFVKIISKNRNNLIKLFLDADRDRWVEQLEKHSNKTVSKKLADKYSITIQIPANYYLDEFRDDFAWISHETRNYNMNIIIYSWTLSDTSSLDRDYLIAMRNIILKENIPGERPGSFMSTETKYDYPYYELIDHKNQPTGILRGLWKVKGDFMGGPFVSYTKIDKPRNRMITVEGFVYHPNEEVRDKIRLLEGVLFTCDLIK
ncbi:MAG: DUF4837 family protein [Bacteroidales bacterium]|nr:DUF4837 family protein [Bacteroidales bacterium]MDD3858719.1 DUF4837 family protein [Bacteroidales bacterium]